MKWIFSIVLLFMSLFLQSQDMSKYNNYVKYLMESQKPEEVSIYVNIVDRAFSLNLEIEDFYKEVNEQSRAALTVSTLYYIDESLAEGEDNGTFMMLYLSALKEGSGKSTGNLDSNQPSFDEHYNWSKVLQSYLLSSGMLRGKIALREKFKFE